MNPTLYHGTDLRIAVLGEQERYAYKDKCLKAAKFKITNYLPNGETVRENR